MHSVLLCASSLQVVSEPDKLWLNEDDDFICNQVIRDDDGYADFTHHCCTRSKRHGRVMCSDDADNKWINIMYSLVAAMKMAFLLFGPWLLQAWIYKGSIGHADYVVQLPQPVCKTLLVKKVQVPDERASENLSQQREMKQFKNFRKLVKSIPSDEIVPVRFQKLHIQVDHKNLLSEKSVPVGLLHFIWTKIFLCGIRKHQPFLTCCKESVFGSWSPKLLWIPLMQKFYCNINWRQFASWGHLFHLLGGVLLMAAIPVPYYIRIIIYYYAEEPEIKDRKIASDQLDLKPLLDHNLFQHLTPTHGALIVVYIVYCLSFVLLALLRSANDYKFDSLVLSAVDDMRRVSPKECLRLFCAHLMLPFEKFGICGLLFGAVYWPLILPVCLLVAVCYAVPTIYIIGRFLIQERPWFLRHHPQRGSGVRNRRYASSSLSDGTSSFEHCLMLPNISPSALHEPASPSKIPRRRCAISLQIFCTDFRLVLIGLVCVVWLCTVLLLYAECFGALAEICALTLMGAIVNASSAANYVMLAFWMITYIASCYNNVYNDYMCLNHKLFAMIKEHLKDDVRRVILLHESRQKNTAYKYLMNDIDNGDHGAGNREAICRADSDDEEQLPLWTDDHNEETIEYINGKLYWDINSLIFFVTKHDVPRIPKALFKQICQLNVPGCPGPVYTSLYKATKQLMYMAIFLLFVFIVVMAFGSAYNVSTTNQLLVTLAGGFIPFVVRFVLKPNKADISLNTYSFDGKINEIIRHFHQPWPVYDLSFDPNGSDGPEGACAAQPDTNTQLQNLQNLQRSRSRGAAMCYDMTDWQMPCGPDIIDQHVDLFITIKDEADEVDLGENLRAEPAGSFGSKQSLQSGARPSPDDPGAAAAFHNNPSNASAYATREPSVASRSVSVQASMGRWGSPVQTVPPGAVAMPHGKSVDLVVDISRGGLPQVRSEPNSSGKNDSPVVGGGGGGGGSMQLLPLASNYRKMTNNDESSL